jgi:sugar phosphate permease
MHQKKLANNSLTGRVQYYQWSIFLTLFIGYATYAYNRKSVSLAMPELMRNGLQKSDAGM